MKPYFHFTITYEAGGERRFEGRFALPANPMDRGLWLINTQEHDQLVFVPQSSIATVSIESVQELERRIEAEKKAKETAP